MPLKRKQNLYLPFILNNNFSLTMKSYQNFNFLLAKTHHVTLGLIAFNNCKRCWEGKGGTRRGKEVGERKNEQDKDREQTML